MSRIWNNRFISQDVSHPICNSILFHFSSCSRLPSFLCISSSVIPFVSLRRLMIIVLYRTYSWQPSKFNNGFNSYTKINHLWRILPYIASLQRNMLPLQYSDILKARSNTPVKVSIISHWIRVERLLLALPIKQYKFCYSGEYVISIACSFITKKFFL